MRFFGALILSLLLAIPAFTRAESPWIYGIHWYGNPNSGDVEAMTGGKPIWVLETVMLYDGGWRMVDQASKFQAIRNKGHEVIIRIQPRWGYSVPLPQDRQQYLNDLYYAVAQAAPFCNTWQIGNEMNLYDEYGGQVLTAQEYVDAFEDIRNVIKSVSSPLGEQKVLLGAISPGAYYQEVRHTDGYTYLDQMCKLLGPNDVDGFALHAYGAPWFDAATARQDLQQGYVNQLDIIDDNGFCDKPAYILEWNRQTNPINDAWQEEQTARFLIGAFEDLAAWNANPNNHPIVCATWFIYPDTPGWDIFSILKLRGQNQRGVNLDLWDSFQYAASLNIPAGDTTPGGCAPTATPTPTPTPIPGDSFVVDNDFGSPSYVETGSWSTSSSGGYDGGTYRYDITGSSGGTATWTANITDPGTYEVFTMYRAGANRPTAARYVVNHAGGATNVNINQTQNSMTWVSLGEFTFNSGSATIILDAAASTASGKAAIADAILFTPKSTTTPTPSPSPSPSPTPSPSPSPSPSATATPTPTPTPTPAPVSVNVYRELAGSPGALSIQPSGSDGIAGNVATRLSGDFHSAVSNNADREPAFTDGAGQNGLAGLLRDYPGNNTAAWSGFWNLSSGSAVDLNDLRVFSGNGDGRAFHHYDVYTTTDSTPDENSAWTLLAEEIAPANFGTAIGSNSAALTRLTGNGGAMATGITAIRIDLYAVHNMDNVLRDDWNAGQGDDTDGVGAAFVSPIVFEIDAFFSGSATPTPTATATATATPSPTPAGGNIVTNGGFEDGFSGGVGNGWTSWRSGWDSSTAFGRTGFTIYEGSSSQYWYSQNAASNGGVYQTVSVTPGASYTITARLRFTGPGSDNWLEFGYDLSGGTAPEAGSVNYTKLEGSGANNWILYSQTVTATGNSITLFSKGGVSQPGGGNNFFYIDAVSMSAN